MRSFEQINLNQFPRRFFLKRWLRLSRASGRDELLLIRFSCRLTAWRGADFDYCRNHRMIARKIWTVPNVVQQAARRDVGHSASSVESALRSRELIRPNEPED